MRNWLAGAMAMASRRKEAESRYWRELPLRSLLPLLGAMAATFASLGFIIDLIEGAARPYPAVVSLALYTGLMAAGLGYIIFRHRRLIIPAVLVFVVVTAALNNAGAAGTRPALAEPLQQRLATDAVLMLVLIMVGFGLALSFIGNAGIAQMRVRTELRLAAEIQQGLVPDVEARLDRFEVCGRSSPGTEVGGDLVDAVAVEAGIFACLADVSGHGVPAGLLTGMVKTAARSALERDASLAGVLDTINRVLPSVKAPAMYATFAGVVLGDDGSGEYATAGHGPILRWRAATNEVEFLALEQFPLGMFQNARFGTAQLRFEPGDVFLAISDGITETANRSGEQFGMDRVQAALRNTANEPLGAIRDRLFREVSAWGAQEDDQTVLLLRVLG